MGDAGENLNRRKFLSEGVENGKETYLRVMDQQECLVMKKGCREVDRSCLKCTLSGIDIAHFIDNVHANVKVLVHGVSGFKLIEEFLWPTWLLGDH